MKLYLNGRSGTHNAVAEYWNNEIRVLAGSKINLRLQFDKISTEAKAKRNDRTIVSESGELLVDVVFKSATAAAQFVTGRSINGLIAWRNEDKMTLKQCMSQNC